MTWRRITGTARRHSYMRSQLSGAGNNKNSISEFFLHPLSLFMLFNPSNTNMRELIVIYVLE